MEDSAQNYCAACSAKILKEWKGWPHKDVVPLLPRISSGVCESCGNSPALESSKICWLNCHSGCSTGLPDYWLLVIQANENKWGHPYFAEGECPKCQSRSIITQMKYPNGKSEICHNCKSCGVTKINKKC